MGVVRCHLKFERSPDTEICAMESQKKKPPYSEINDKAMAVTPDRFGYYIFFCPQIRPMATPNDRTNDPPKRIQKSNLSSYLPIIIKHSGAPISTPMRRVRRWGYPPYHCDILFRCESEKWYA